MTGSARGRVERRLISAVLLLFAAVYLFPTFWMILTSLKKRAEIFTWPPTFLPSSIGLQHYVELVNNRDLLPHVMSSLIVTAAGALVATALGTLAAYGLVRLRWPRELNRQLSLWVLSLRMMPPISALIPMVILWGHLHLVDSYLGLILAYIFFPLPLAIWLMQIFLSSIPDEISEAAQVEGASHFQTLLHVVVPLARPGLATTLLLSANLIWNEFLFASQLSGSRTATLPVLIAGFLGDRAMDWGPLAAAGTISVLPMVLIAVVAQRHIVAGLTLGAVKD